jgi:antitoxin ParD1/3/4
MNIYLGKHFEEFIRAQVESGRYANASEVVREALRRQEIDEAKLAHLRAKIDEGLTSIERGDVTEIDDVDAYFEDLMTRTIARTQQQMKSA